MKTILIAAAAAFAFVSPAAAQPAQQANAHQGHDMSAHAGHDMSQHKSQAADGQQGHQSGQSANKMDCCADRDGNGKMDCCEKMQTSEARDCCADHAQHKKDDQSAAAPTKG